MIRIRQLRKEFGKARIRNRLRDVVILMYHRVNDLPDYPYPVVVRPQAFAQHMHHLNRHYEPMSLRELVKAQAHESLPPRGVVITFDDGYIDNFTKALPILEENRVPATIFVSTGNIDSEREFWWDELDRIILMPGEKPEKLEMRIQGQANSWPTITADERAQARREVHLLLKPLMFAERELHLEELSDWADQSREGRPNHFTMSANELSQLVESGLIEVGAHTVTHPQLSTLSYEEQSKEVVDGRKRLETIIGKPVELFAYPYGAREDYNSDSVRIMKTCGFQAACTTVRGKIELGADLYELPRFPVDDWDLETFEYQLFNFFNS